MFARLVNAAQTRSFLLSSGAIAQDLSKPSTKSLDAIEASTAILAGNPDLRYAAGIYSGDHRSFCTCPASAAFPGSSLGLVCALQIEFDLEGFSQVVQHRAMAIDGLSKSLKVVVAGIADDVDIPEDF